MCPIVSSRHPQCKIHFCSFTAFIYLWSWTNKRVLPITILVVRDFYDTVRCSVFDVASDSDTPLSSLLV
ncbi:hypothetical protein BDR03DRAFT_948690 [Suillus americanus]|nr:hypothetical protein BDR03DRAFT_948690 [Suillus americanus]